MEPLILSPLQIEDEYTLPTYAKPQVALVRGDNATVWDSEGRPYLDLYGGHCVAILGHCPPEVVEAVQKQAETLLFYSNAMYSPVRAEAAERLAALAPEGLKRSFFCNSGTEANETALKLARAFTGRSKVVAMLGGFHGRTLGSLAVTSGEKYHKHYEAVLPATTFVPFDDAPALGKALSGDDAAAVILEPIQSMAGVIEAAEVYYRQVRDLCDRHGTQLIFDEVQTGVGRTGTFSYSEHVGITPDLITLAKSLGSGVPVGAVLVGEHIAATVKTGDQGTTFGGGMLAMAAVNATLATIEKYALMIRADVIYEVFAEEALDIVGVEDVRGRGALIGIQLDRPAKPVVESLREQGVIVGGSDEPHTIRLMPPLTVPFESAETFGEALRKALD
ncbi:aminotransferase class III-fold pyridoxal phosphate-dependent enzyme [soil metagenome]